MDEQFDSHRLGDTCEGLEQCQRPTLLDAVLFQVELKFGPHAAERLQPLHMPGDFCGQGCGTTITDSVLTQAQLLERTVVLKRTCECERCAVCEWRCLSAKIQERHGSVTMKHLRKCNCSFVADLIHLQIHPLERSTASA